MFRKILIDIRDHAYHYAKKQTGPHAAKSDFISKLWAILLFYYVGILMLVAHLIAQLFSLQPARQVSLPVRFVVGLIFAVLPIWLLTKGVLSIIADTPIPEQLSEKEYTAKRLVSLSVLVIGILFFLACAVLPVYFTGGTIHIGDYVIQRK